MDEYSKVERILEIFFKGMRGEELSVQQLADEYEVSSRSVSRDINDLKAFLADHRELVGNTELEYNYQNKRYSLKFDDFLQSNELLAVIEILIGSRALKSEELLKIISKLKEYVTCSDKKLLETIIRKEVYRYQEVKHDCSGVIDNVWKISKCIDECREISIIYYRMDRKEITRRIRPQAILFSEYYFYLIAYHADDDKYTPVYYRLDRITDITIHRDYFDIPADKSFDEGEFRKKIQFMWPGHEQKIRFEFTGPSVQAILDRIPMSKVVEVKGSKYIVEAEVYGDGIKMYLLSQGSWVKVLSPESLKKQMAEEINKMQQYYNE